MANYVPLNMSRRVHVRDRGRRSGFEVAWLLDDPGGVTDALGVTLVEGRSLERGDANVAAGEARPAILTERLAEKIFGSASALGQELATSDGSEHLRVVGVARSFTAVFAPNLDAENAIVIADRPWLSRTFRYLVRTPPGHRDGTSASVVAALRSRGLPRAIEARPLVEGARLAASTNRGAQGTALTMAAFIVVVVLFGRVSRSSFLVAERRHQVRILRALGATRRNIVAWFLLEGVAVTVPGILLGGALTAFLGFVARRIAPEVQAGDLVPPTLVISVVLSAIGIGAMIVPAIRAAAIPAAKGPAT